MNKDTASYYYNLLKGRIAENITEELFNELKFNIERFGMENQLPSISKLLKKHENTSSVKKIRTMPDFIIEKDGLDVYFLEVKYRYNEKFQIKHLKQYADYAPNILFLVYSLEDAFILRFDEVDKSLEDEEFIPLQNKLIDSPIFNFNNVEKQTIHQFLNLGKEFFTKFDHPTDVAERVVCN